MLADQADKTKGQTIKQKSLNRQSGKGSGRQDCGYGQGSKGKEAAISVVLKEETQTELVDLADILGEHRAKGITVYIKVKL